MQGVLKVGRDCFVFFDSETGLVRRMERNDAYKMIRLCDSVLIGRLKLIKLSDSVLIGRLKLIKLEKLTDSVPDFLEIPYEGDLDANVTCDQDDDLSPLWDEDNLFGGDAR